MRVAVVVEGFPWRLVGRRAVVERLDAEEWLGRLQSAAVVECFVGRWVADLLRLIGLTGCSPGLRPPDSVDEVFIVATGVRVGSPGVYEDWELGAGLEDLVDHVIVGFYHAKVEAVGVAGR